MADAIMQVWYVELKGEAAQKRLARFLELLPGQVGFRGAELLVSPAQPGLALLASRWAGELPDLPVPDGAKHWTFTVMESRP